MTSDPIEIQQSAKIALSSLTEADRERVMAEIDRLAEASVGAPSGQGHSLSRLIVLPTLDRLRIVYAIGPDHTVVINTILNEDLIDRYFRKPAAVG